MRATILLLALLSLAGPLLAQGRSGQQAGEFDYYVMSLTWSPGWCDREGETRDQCDPRRRTAFVLHGLWPQHERGGWPEFCRTQAHDPARSETAAMADIMGSPGLAWYQWKKHGRCAGLSSRDYFTTARRAFEAVRIPTVFTDLRKDVKLPASVVEEAFVEANPGLAPDMITVTCSQGHIAEVRLCLTKDLEPRRCGADVIRDCRMKDALLAAP